VVKIELLILFILYVYVVFLICFKTNQVQIEYFLIKTTMNQKHVLKTHYRSNK